MKTKKGPLTGKKYKDNHPFEFGRILALQRRKKGLTQTELGEIMGVSKRVVSRYEREVENPPIEMIKNVSKALKVSPKIFLEPSDNEEKDEQTIGWKLRRKLDLVKTLPLPYRAQKSLEDYLDVLVRTVEKNNL